MTVWIFSNDTYGYGKEILESCVRHCERQNVKTKVIFSGRPHRAMWPTKEHLTAGAIMCFSIRTLRYLRWKWQAARRSAFSPLIVANVNSWLVRARVGKDDVGIIAGFDQIFKKTTIERFATLLNVHPSLLPYYRGPTPSYWCIKNQENVSGFTIHRVTSKIDSGEMIHQEVVPIADDMDESALDHAISVRAASAMPAVLDSLVNRSALEHKLVDASTLYRVHVDYTSFRK